MIRPQTLQKEETEAENMKRTILAKVTLERSQEPRELALWDDAVARLLKKSYIKKIGRNDPIFQVTTMGYSIADGFKKDNELYCSKSPAEILDEFDII